MMSDGVVSYLWNFFAALGMDGVALDEWMTVLKVRWKLWAVLDTLVCNIYTLRDIIG